MSVDLRTTNKRRRLERPPPPETTSESEENTTEGSPADVELEAEVDDVTNLPSITLPPGVKVNSYLAVVGHFEQSKFIFDAFKNKFRMTSCCISILLLA